MKKKQGKNKVVLNTKQKKHLKSIQWLYGDDRGSGRTTLLAYVFIDKVLSTGEPMRIVDHHPHIRSNINLADIIESAIHEHTLPLEVLRHDLILKIK